MKKDQSKHTILKLFVVLVYLACTGIAFHRVKTEIQLKQYKAPGELVKVSGETMHVYIKGKGNPTILLMAKPGTTAPVLDFEPLINELSQENRVVVVESFGSGWSSQTSEKRSVENIVSEEEKALEKAGVNGPYILMPVAESGIYATYFANQSPQDVKAVIGLNCILPQEYEYCNETMPKEYDWEKYLAPIGLTRVGTLVNPGSFISKNTNGSYSRKNLEAQKAVAAWKAKNVTVINEINSIKENAESTKDITFSQQLPILFLYSQQEMRSKKLSEFYDTQITNSQIQRSKSMESMESRNIAEEVKMFLAECVSNGD